MGRTWVLTVLVVTVLELSVVMGYVPEPLPTYNTDTQPTQRPVPLSTRRPKPVQTRRPKPLPTIRPKMTHGAVRDESAIVFPEDTVVDSRRHTGSKRSLPDSGNAAARFSDIYPQTQFSSVERLVRQDLEVGSGPQNSWGNPQPQWGNPGFNNPSRRPQNRPGTFPSNQPNWGGGGGNQQGWGGGGGNQQGWGGGGGNNQQGGGNLNGPPNDDYDEAPFVFDQSPANGGGGRPPPGNGGANRPRPGNNGGGAGRPPGNAGANRPRPGNNGGGAGRPPGNAGVNRPPPGNGGGSGRPRPSTRPPATPATTTPQATATTRTTRPPPGAPVTMPTPAPTRPGCNCPSTPEFNPVCGQDRVTYTNPGKLRCANACGNNVMMLHFGACVTTTTSPPSR